MPTGKVKWYDVEKGFGFLSQEEGEDVYVRASALPEGVEGLKAGQRVEFGMAAGRRGPQALSLKVLEPAPSLRGATATRREPVERKHTPDQLHGMVEDMITLLEAKVQPDLRNGKYPDGNQVIVAGADLRVAAGAALGAAGAAAARAPVGSNHRDAHRRARDGPRHQRLLLRAQARGAPTQRIVQLLAH